MPVKIRCRSCQKILNAPDRARGKAIKCPNCEETIRVPSGDGKQPRRRKAPAQPRKSSAPDVESSIVNVDLRHAEDSRVQVCPKCGAEVTEEEIDCRACGIDLATGKVSIRTLRKKGLAVADPKEFYGKAWSNSARFVLDNKNLVLRTGNYWTVLTLLLGGSSGLCNYFIVDYPAPEVDPSDMEILLGGKWPLVVFFGILSFLFLAGTLGWYWRLAIEVIRITMAKKKKKITKVNFDFFEALALGCKVFFWSYVFMIPINFVVSLVLVPMAIVSSFVMPVLGPLVIGLIVLGVYAIPLLVFPVAMVHMSMPYTYKAWLPTEMIKIWAKNIGPALYWLMLFVVVNLPMIGILAGIALLSNQLADFIDSKGILGGWTTWILAQVWESGIESGFLFYCLWIPMVIFFAFLIVTPICLLAAVPAVFTMRANGLLAFYRKDSLELIREKTEHEKAGFWVRYLAYLVDSVLIMLTPFIMYKNQKAMVLIWTSLAFLGLSYFFATEVFPILSLLVIILFGWCYFALSEGSPEQGTMGKHAIGLVVLSEKSMTNLTLKEASFRFLAKILSGLPLGIGFVLAAFTPKKQALHDLMAKTVVVFRGDDDATTS
ncbi:MAG: RDD family protein [Planctomycetes bacterium]|nr:RDD family protein [Planctomycetota bacterium]